MEPDTLMGLYTVVKHFGWEALKMDLPRVEGLCLIQDVVDRHEKYLVDEANRRR